jgi:hypothetical protein
VQCEAAAAKPAACSLQKAASKQSVVAASKHCGQICQKYSRNLVLLARPRKLMQKVLHRLPLIKVCCFLTHKLTFIH